MDFASFFPQRRDDTYIRCTRVQTTAVCCPAILTSVIICQNRSSRREMQELHLLQSLGFERITRKVLGVMYCCQLVPLRAKKLRQ